MPFLKTKNPNITIHFQYEPGTSASRAGASPRLIVIDSAGCQVSPDEATAILANHADTVEEFKPKKASRKKA